jgi:hypothetical protein
MLSPFRDLAQADLVFRGVSIYGGCEFGHGAGIRRAYIVLAKLRHGDGDGLTKALGIHIEAVQNALRIGERNAATGTRNACDHSPDIRLFFA